MMQEKKREWYEETPTKEDWKYTGYVKKARRVGDDLFFIKTLDHELIKINITEGTYLSYGKTPQDLWNPDGDLIPTSDANLCKGCPLPDYRFLQVGKYTKTHLNKHIPNTANIEWEKCCCFKERNIEEESKK